MPKEERFPKNLEAEHAAFFHSPFSIGLKALPELLCGDVEQSGRIDALVGESGYVLAFGFGLQGSSRLTSRLPSFYSVGQISAVLAAGSGKSADTLAPFFN